MEATKSKLWSKTTDFLLYVFWAYLCYTLLISSILFWKILLLIAIILLAMKFFVNIGIEVGNLEAKSEINHLKQQLNTCNRVDGMVMFLERNFLAQVEQDVASFLSETELNNYVVSLDNGFLKISIGSDEHMTDVEVTGNFVTDMEKGVMNWRMSVKDDSAI